MFVWVHVRLMNVQDIGQLQMSFLILIFSEAWSPTGMDYTKSYRLAVQQDPETACAFFLNGGWGFNSESPFFLNAQANS